MTPWQSRAAKTGPNRFGELDIFRFALRVPSSSQVGVLLSSLRVVRCGQAVYSCMLHAHLGHLGRGPYYCPYGGSARWPQLGYMYATPLPEVLFGATRGGEGWPGMICLTDCVCVLCRSKSVFYICWRHSSIVHAK